MSTLTLNGNLCYRTTIVSVLTITAIRVSAMGNNKVKALVMSGLFIAIGILMPIVFHSAGIGNIFLPMHIPVMLAGFFLSIPFALVVGVATPLLSSMITGMPPFFPVMPYMVAELAAYAIICSLMYRKLRLNAHISLVISMIAGRIAAAGAVWVLMTFFAANLMAPLEFITTAIVAGLPGIVVQLLIIPAVVAAVEKNFYVKKKGQR